MTASALRFATLAVIGAALTGCATAGPDAVCAQQARQYGPDFAVAGAFSTTVGRIRALAPGGQPDRWPELAPEAAATLCYLDGTVAKGPPPGLDGIVPPSFDRAVVAVVAGHAEMVMAGYRDRLPISAP